MNPTYITVAYFKSIKNCGELCTVQIPVVKRVAVRMASGDANLYSSLEPINNSIQTKRCVPGLCMTVFQSWDTMPLECNRIHILQLCIIICLLSDVLNDVIFTHIIDKYNESSVLVGIKSVLLFHK